MRYYFGFILVLVFLVLITNSVSAREMSDCLKIKDDIHNNIIWFGLSSGSLTSDPHVVRYWERMEFSKCVTEVAIEKGDASLCKKEYNNFISGINPSTDFYHYFCVAEVAANEKNIALCNYVPEAYYSNTCSQMAREKINNPDFCGEPTPSKPMELGGRFTSCLEKYGEESNYDLSICDMFGGGYNTEHCIRIFLNRELRDIKDPKVCLKYAEYEKRNCLFHVASMNIDESACNYFEKTTDKQRCKDDYINSLAIFEGDESICLRDGYFIDIPGTFHPTERNTVIAGYTGAHREEECIRKAKHTKIAMQCSKDLYIPDVTPSEVFEIVKNAPIETRNLCIPKMGYTYYNHSNLNQFYPAKLQLCSFMTKNQLRCVKTVVPGTIGGAGELWKISNTWIVLSLWIIIALILLPIYYFKRDSDEKISLFLFGLFIASIAEVILTEINHITELIHLPVLNVIISYDAWMLYAISHIINYLSIARIIAGILFILLSSIIAYYISRHLSDIESKQKIITIITIIAINIIAIVLYILSAFIMIMLAIGAS
ncbi:hypothetical protein KY338_06240 [Candidatus Woesearchaeota archaeon]|nr:hypothetical protein [Candidatus Woesearchaeota archaeon]